MEIVRIHTVTIHRIEVSEPNRAPREFIRILQQGDAPDYQEIKRDYCYIDSIDFYQCHPDEIAKLESMFNEFTLNPKLDSSLSLTSPIQLTQFDIAI